MTSFVHRTMNGLKRRALMRLVPQKVNLRPLLQPLVLGEQAAVSDLSQQVNRELHRHLHGYSGIAPEYIGTLVNAVQELWASPDRATVHEAELAQMTRDVPPTALPARRWFALYDVCFTYGLLDLLLPLRAKAVESALEEEQRRPNRWCSVEFAFRAAMNQGQFAEAERLLGRLETLTKHQDKLTSYRLFYLFLTGQKDAAAPLARKFVKHHANSELFRKLIEGRRVAVVGPAPTGELTGEEIDAHDIVVRINYRGADRLGDPAEFGTRTDVSYYNGQDSRYMHDKKDYEFLGDLQACAFKSFSHKFQLQQQSKGAAREIVQPRLLFNGAALQGLNAVYDLLHFAPEELKLFKNNLFLSTNPYDEKYREYHIDRTGRKAMPRTSG